MITITLINCNQGSLDGPLKVLTKIYKEFEIKHPNWFHLMRYQRGSNNWDGKIHYIKENGRFRIGLLPMIYQWLVDNQYKVKVIDKRPPLGIVPSIPLKVGNLKLRDEQKYAIAGILGNRVGGVPFMIGVGDLAMNFGKSLLMASLYHAFNKKLRTLLITNDSDWLQQARKEFPELIDSKELTFVQGGNCMGWKGFTIGMVQSLSRNIKKYQSELSKIDMVLIDEADIIDNKTYQTVIEHLYNTRIRIGLSGTIYLSKLKKDLMHNMNIRSFIGEKLVEVKLHEMIKKGYSTDVVVKMIPSRYRLPKDSVDYKDEYDAMITNNKQGYQLSLERMQFNIKYGRLPALVVTKFIKHCENLYAHYNKELGDTYNIAKVHVDTPKKERNKIIEDFRNGKIDILISTTITSRGKNFPLLRYLQNAGDGDSNERAIQILGRLVRTHKSKKKTYYDDIWYNGTYLSRHARHRKNYYLRERLKVIDLTRKRKRK